MGSQAWSSLPLFLLVVLMVSGGGAMAAPLRRPVPVPFGRNYVPTWAFDHIKYYNGGSQIELYLDKYTGTVVNSLIHTVDKEGTALLLLLHNLTPSSSSVRVIKGPDSSQKATTCSDISAWTLSWFLGILLVWFFVDDVPIRVFKNCKDLGVRFPFYQPMKIYSSLWNADDWATRGGLEKTDWSKAPFVAAYRGFHIDGCEASVEAKFCATQGMRWWDQKEFQDLDSFQYQRLGWVRQKYTVYNYCTDRSRYPTMPPECTRDKDA
ncbi:hypothetical protein SAY87_024334 [Trapa incisa]|uniref:Xyloglucan endotransglucosylase/hydrolase n=1 Tax=Trapa incisa TaxID=236973 RepID=A0AAN7GCM5_9MYRT|nr:hypothetical protein SAY87_024334 [Trapa incisa]